MPAMGPPNSGSMPSAVLTPVFTSQSQVVQPPAQPWGSWPNREVTQHAPADWRSAGGQTRWQSSTAQPAYVSGVMAPPTATAAAPRQAQRPMTLNTGPTLYQNNPDPSSNPSSVANAFNPWGSQAGGPGSSVYPGPLGPSRGGPGGPAAGPADARHGSQTFPSGSVAGPTSDRESLMHCEPGERIVSSTFGEGVLVSTSMREGAAPDNHPSISPHLNTAGGSRHGIQSGQPIQRLDANDHHGPPGQANQHPSHPRNNSRLHPGHHAPHEPPPHGSMPPGWGPPGAGQHPGHPGGPAAPDRNGNVQMTAVTVIDRGVGQTLTDHDFPYHDPAYGFGWRYHYTDSLDLQLSEQQFDHKRAPLEELAHEHFLRETENEWERAHGRHNGDQGHHHRPPGIRRVPEPGREPEPEGLMGWLFGPEPQRQPGAPQHLML